MKKNKEVQTIYVITKTEWVLDKSSYECFRIGGLNKL